MKTSISVYGRTVSVGKLKSRRILFVFIGLMLISSSTFAIDEDFYIPYTDTYGYEYDPETGRFMKKEIPSRSASEAPSGGAGIKAATPPRNHAAGLEAKTSAGTKKAYLVTLVAVVGFLVLAGISYRLRQGRAATARESAKRTSAIEGKNL